MKTIRLTVVLCGFLASYTAHAATFTNLGYLPGGAQGGATGVSDDGKVVVGASPSQAFRWTAASGMQLLPGAGAFAADVSKDGKVVGGHFSSSSGSQAALWINGSLVPLADPTGASYLVDVRDLNDDGSVVIGIASSVVGFPEAFRWSSGVIIGTHVISDPYGVTGDGSIFVGGTSDGLGFRWDNGQMSALPLKSTDTRGAPIGISTDGSVIVGYSGNAGGTTAARWENNAIESIGELPGGLVSATANGCSRYGEVIVGGSQTGIADPFGYHSEAFIWDRCRGMRNLKTVLEVDYGLNLTGWILVSAEDVSSDGRFVVGVAINPSGRQEPFLVELPPLPASQTEIARLQNELATCVSDNNASIAALQLQLANAQAANATLQGQLALANTQVSTLQNELATCSSEKALLGTSLSAAESRILTLEQELETARSENAALQTTLANGLAEVEGFLQQSDPTFFLPGSTPTTKFNNLIDAIVGLNPGLRNLLYKALDTIEP